MHSLSTFNDCRDSELLKNGKRLRAVRFVVLGHGRVRGGAGFADLAEDLDAEVKIVDLTEMSGPGGLGVLKSDSVNVIDPDEKSNRWSWSFTSADKLTTGIWDTKKEGVLPVAFCFGTGGDTSLQG